MRYWNKLPYYIQSYTTNRTYYYLMAGNLF